MGSVVGEKTIKINIIGGAIRNAISLFFFIVISAFPLIKRINQHLNWHTNYIHYNKYCKVFKAYAKIRVNYCVKGLPNLLR